MDEGTGNGLTPGQRIKRARTRAGMSRTVLAGLVDRSAEWVKAVETGRLHTPRLPMLLRLAQALDLADLAELTGDGQAVPVKVFAGRAHAALAEVRAALTDYRITRSGQAPDVRHLALRLNRAWDVRHASPDHRTQLGLLLPALIRDAQQAVRMRPAGQRREARRVLAGVYQLADFYVAFQPAPELLWLVADRAVSEGQEADDPYTAAGGAWALVQALRETGRWEESLAVALDAAGQLEPHLENAPDDWRGLWGALQFEAAYTYGRRGRSAPAWRHWDTAAAAADRLGAGYRHTQTSFSQVVIGAHATTLAVELRRPGEALRAAGFDAELIPSVPRRARHLVEVARAYRQRGDRHGMYALLDKAERTAPETVQYNGFARDMLLELNANPPAAMRAEVRALGRRVGLLD